MEHSILREWEQKNNIQLGIEKEKLLWEYAELVYHANKRFNLAGLKTRDDILINLVLGSIEPLLHLDVPRGTLFADIGTGAGIPGIPVAIYHDELAGVLIDSNGKKISFVKKVIRDLLLDNVQPLQERIETAARTRLRNAFHIVFSRALGSISVVAELAAPMLVSGGLLYVYSHERAEDLPAPVAEHIGSLGMSALSIHKRARYGLSDVNMVFIKTGATQDTFPRNMSAIKRDLNKFTS